MADQVRKIDILIGTNYDGKGVQIASADVAGLQSKLASMNALQGASSGGLGRLFANLNSMRFVGGAGVQGLNIAPIEEAKRSHEIEMKREREAQIKMRNELSAARVEAEKSSATESVQDLKSRVDARIQQRLQAQGSMMEELQGARQRGVADYERKIAAVHENLAQQQQRRDTQRDWELGRPMNESREDLATRMRGGLSEREMAGRKAAASEHASYLAQERRLTMAMRGFGTIAISELVGKSLQNLPKATDEFYLHIRSGMTATQAFTTALADAIPVIGDLARGFQGAFVALGDVIFPDRAKARIESEQKQKDRDATTREKERINAIREGIISQGTDLAYSSGQSLAVSGKFGFERQMAVAEQERSAKNRSFEKLRSQALSLPVGGLNMETGDIDPNLRRNMMAQIASAEEAADQELADKKILIEKERNKEFEDNRREHADRLRDIEEQTNQTDLATQHRYYDAKIQAAKDGERKVVEAAFRTWQDEEKNPDIDHAESLKRFVAESEASARRLKSTIANINEENNREAEESRIAHNNRMYDVQSSQYERLERLSGDSLAADKESLARHRQDQINEINRNTREQLIAHKDRAAEIKTQAKESLKGVESDYAIGLAEMMVNLGRQFAVHPTGTTPLGDSRLLTGTGSQFKQGQNLSDVLAEVKRIRAAMEKGAILQVPPNLN